MTLLFIYLAHLKNDCLVTLQCMQFTFGDKIEVNLLDKSALPVTEKESKPEGKMSICPGISLHVIFYPRADAQFPLCFILYSRYFG